MTQIPDRDFDYGDYDTPEDITVDTSNEPLPYANVEDQDATTTEAPPLAFTATTGKTPEEAIATARLWSNQRRFMGIGQCLAAVRQYYGVNSKYGTAAASWWAADHKRSVAHGSDCPRGVPVYWTGGSHGAGHIAISLGGGLCYSTDWHSAGRIDIARIDSITSAWNLHFQGYAYEVNDVQVWAPSPPQEAVSLKNLQPGKRNNDVLQVKKKLRAKGYTGFLVHSKRFGTGFRRAYGRYQARLGFDGKSADGLPGATSLRKLGFKVTR